MTPWFPYNSFAHHSKLRLFCFSHSGGSASYFRKWQPFFPNDIEICPVQLPGRETRFLEPFITNMEHLTQVLWPQMVPFLSSAYAFFGHSLGAIVAYELAKRAKINRIMPPCSLFVSACSAPNCLDGKESLHTLPDDVFIEHLKEYGGTSSQIFENAEMLNVLLARLRADFTLFETYTDLSPESLEVDITALGGDGDTFVPLENLQKWKNYTKMHFNLKSFPGGHFYPFDQVQELCEVIREDLLHPFKIQS